VFSTIRHICGGTLLGKFRSFSVIRSVSLSNFRSFRAVIEESTLRNLIRMTGRVSCIWCMRKGNMFQQPFCYILLLLYWLLESPSDCLVGISAISLFSHLPHSSASFVWTPNSVRFCLTI